MRRCRLAAPAYFNPRSLHGERHQLLLPFLFQQQHFNPRSLHGERHAVERFYALSPAFQSTLPARGATKLVTCFSVAKNISIHAPCTGSDVISVLLTSASNISIHAPCTGSDRARNAPNVHVKHFNPRSLHGERLARKI